MIFDHLSTDITPSGILLALSLLLVAGFVCMVLGRKLPRQGDWLASLGLIAVLALSCFGLTRHLASGTPSALWRAGWVWPRRESGALHIGLLGDSLAFAFAAVISICGFVLISDRPTLRSQRHPERFYAAVSFGACGAALAWFSLSAWLAFIGIAIAAVAGFISLGSHWNTESEATLATRFAGESVFGLGLAVLGAFILTSHDNLLVWSDAITPWKDAPITVVGSSFLLVGLFLQFHSFPLLGWSGLAAGTPAPTKVLLTQVFPGMAAFAILARLEPQIRVTGILPVAGWFAITAAALSALTGILQADWRLSLNTWTGTGFSIALAALCFAGAPAGTQLMLAVGLSAFSVALFANALELGGASSISNHKRALWCKIGAFASSAMGAGMLGFISASGSAQAIALCSESVGGGIVFALSFFLYALLAWKTVWIISDLKNNSEAPWVSILPALIIPLLALSLLWTGALVGGVFPGRGDVVFTSTLADYFANAARNPEADLQSLAPWLHLIALVLAILIAYWTVGRKNNAWESFNKSFPRLATFIRRGYGIDFLSAHLARGARWTGDQLVAGVDRKLWDVWVPGGASFVITRVSALFSKSDGYVSEKLAATVRRTVDVPSKFLQLLQSGDLQWYILFAVGSGVAILLHFLRFQ
jgi:hypothetical protein